MNRRQIRLILICGLIIGASQFGLGASSRAFGEVISVITDTTWRGIGPLGNQERTPITSVGLAWEAANPGWNTSLTYDDSDAAGWKSCIHNRELPYIWVDGDNWSGSTPSYYRKVFELPGTPTSGLLSFGCDDDVIIYINGQLAISDTDGRSTDRFDIDVTSLLVQGTNLIAVKAHDSWGANESFKVNLDIEVAALTVKIVKTTGSPYPIAALYNPFRSSPSFRLEAQIDPPGPRNMSARYDWSIVSGEDKVRLMFPTFLPSVLVKPISPSDAWGDVEIKVTYTLDSQPYTASYRMTVQKPTCLKVVQGFPKEPKREYDSEGRVMGYVVEYSFQVCDHFPDAHPIYEEGMPVQEWKSLCCTNWSKRHPTNMDPHGRTNANGRFGDELGYPNTHEPIPENFLMKVNQSISVAGWDDVGTRCQIFHYDNATSEDGSCTGCD